MPTVHLLYGFAGSGKTTHARRLESGGPAVRFTLDEWMIRLYPGMRIESPEYGPRAAAVKDFIWELAQQVILAGVDVVLDWNSWSVERREWASDRARAVGAVVRLHWLTTELDEASRRAVGRATEGTPYAHDISPEGNAHLANLMEDPSESEGLDILRI